MKSEMPRERALRIDRFMRLPRRTGETWQGGGVLLPFFSAGEVGAAPVRQAAIAWANLATDDVLVSGATPSGSSDPTELLDVFLDLGLRNRKVREGRPARIEVRDASLGAFIKDALGDDGLEVVVVPALGRIDAEVARIVEVETEDVTVPGVLETPGVDLQRLRAFADAAAACRAREIWYDIVHDDLVLIEEPPPPEGMAGFAAILVDDASAIEFYASREEFEDQEADADHHDLDHHDADAADSGFDSDAAEQASSPSERAPLSPWRVEFVHLHELPVRDVSAWADLGLPVGAPDGYPLALKREDDETFVRPDGARLSFLEGLMRVLAETTESEIDSGRWTRTVPTADGPVSYRLAVPSLLDGLSGGDADRRANEQRVAMLSRFLEAGQFESLEEALQEAQRRGITGANYVQPETAEERARDLVYVAVGAPGRRRKQLLREALGIWPDAFEAYLHLGEAEPRSDRAVELFEAGRAAAERRLGAERLAEARGRYWDDAPLRPYLRLLMGLAVATWRADRSDAAVSHLRELLALDHADHAGARDYLLAYLLELGLDGEAADLADRYEDGGAAWRYGRALLAYRLGSKDATRRLLDAYAANPLVAGLLAEALLGSDAAAEILPRSADVDHDDEEDAAECADLLLDAWSSTRGAAEWVAAEAKRALRTRRGGRTSRRR